MILNFIKSKKLILIAIAAMSLILTATIFLVGCGNSDGNDGNVPPDPEIPISTPINDGSIVNESGIKQKLTPEQLIEWAKLEIPLSWDEYEIVIEGDVVYIISNETGRKERLEPEYDESNTIARVAFVRVETPTPGSETPESDYDLTLADIDFDGFANEISSTWNSFSDNVMELANLHLKGDISREDFDTQFNEMYNSFIEDVTIPINNLSETVRKLPSEEINDLLEEAGTINGLLLRFAKNNIDFTRTGQQIEEIIKVNMGFGADLYENMFRLITDNELRNIIFND